MAMPTRYSTFFNESLQKQQQKYHPTVGLSRHKIYAEQFQKKGFLVVGIDIYFVVTN